MAMVKDELKINFSDGAVYILLDSCDDEGYGVDVTGEEGVGGALVGMCTFSFGHDENAEIMANDWGTYLYNQFRKLEGKSDATDEMYLVLDEFFCQYEEGSNDHLIVMEKMKAKMKEKEKEDEAFIQEFLHNYGAIDCGKCESLDVETLGTYQSDENGMYVDIKCKSCKKVSQDGDGEFWSYHTLSGSSITKKDEMGL